MPITVLCPSCGKKLQAPDSAAGKQAKCPHCGEIMQLPEAVLDAEEVADESGLQDLQEPPGGFTDGDFDDIYSTTDDPPAESPEGPRRRPCPACGESIVHGAAKCRFCGEIFDLVLKKQEKKQHSDADSDLTTGDWVLAILCSGIGCIAGIIWLIQGKPKGGKMLGASVLFGLLWGVLRGILGSMAQM